MRIIGGDSQLTLWAVNIVPQNTTNFLFLQAQQRLMACTELLGEREETILELKADIDDMKVMYREQIELVVGELTSYRSPSGAASSVHSWNPANES